MTGLALVFGSCLSSRFEGFVFIFRHKCKKCAANKDFGKDLSPIIINWKKNPGCCQSKVITNQSLQPMFSDSFRTFQDLMQHKLTAGWILRCLLLRFNRWYQKASFQRLIIGQTKSSDKKKKEKKSLGQCLCAGVRRFIHAIQAFVYLTVLNGESSQASAFVRDLMKRGFSGETKCSIEEKKRAFWSEKHQCNKRKNKTTSCLPNQAVIFFNVGLWW